MKLLLMIASAFFIVGFIAKNLNGQTVEGTACSGLLLKNTTLRF